MKYLLTALLCLGALSSFADEKEGKTFEEKKAKMSSVLEAKEKHLSETKSCVSNAKDEAALKACKEKMREHRKEMKKMWDKKKKK